MVKDMVTVLGATDELTPGHPAVVLLGPAASVESDDQLPVLRSMFPEVRVVSVADAPPDPAPPADPPTATAARPRGPRPRPRPRCTGCGRSDRRRPARGSASSAPTDDRPTIGPTIGRRSARRSGR